MGEDVRSSKPKRRSWRNIFSNESKSSQRLQPEDLFAAINQQRHDSPVQSDETRSRLPPYPSENPQPNDIPQLTISGRAFGAEDVKSVEQAQRSNTQEQNSKPLSTNSSSSVPDVESYPEVGSRYRNVDEIATRIKSLDNLDDLDHLLDVVALRMHDLGKSSVRATDLLVKYKKPSPPAQSVPVAIAPKSSAEEDDFWRRTFKLEVTPPVEGNAHSPSSSRPGPQDLRTPSPAIPTLPKLNGNVSSFGAIDRRLLDSDANARKQYTYNPLENEQEIRLLSVRYSKEKSLHIQPQFSLITTTLDSKINYETVSYVWGSERRDRRLNFIDGSYLMINENLFEALPSLSWHCSTAYLWIDQICIDQTNVLERNHQVKAMGDIYRRGKRVFIFLGVVLWANDLVEFNKLIEITNEAERKNASAVELQSALADMIKPGKASTYWSYVVKLFKHMWWQRSWVFQEAVLSNSATFIIGSRHSPKDIATCDRLINFDILFRLALATVRIETAELKESNKDQCLTQLPAFYQFYAMAQARSERAIHGKPRNFWQLLSEIAPNSHSSDEKDIVYAFVGLLEDADVNIQPDYQIDLIDMFTRTARAYIDGKHSLDVLGFVPRIKGRGFKFSRNVPSWAPLWKEPEAVLPFTFAHNCPFRASAERPHEILGQPISPGVLKVRGKIIATIDHVFPAIESSEHWTTRDLSSCLQLEVILAEIVGLIAIDEIKEWRPEAAVCTRERLLRVALADGILLYENSNQKAEDMRLSDAQMKTLASAYNRTHYKDPSLVQKHIDDEALTADVHTVRNLSRIAMVRSVFRASDGRLGLAHHSVVSGDTVAILHGSKTPVILRILNGKSGPDVVGGISPSHETKGQCYFERAMYGEEVTWSEDEGDVFQLS